MWFIDIETAAREDIESLVPEVNAPGNIKDPAKIEAAKAEKRQKLIDMAAVNVNFARIGVLGYGEGPEWTFKVNHTEDDEMHGLDDFWQDWTGAGCPPLCGFFNSQFDMPLIVRRSQILDVRMPSLALGRYKHPMVIDLAQILTFDWMLDAEKLSTYARVFGLPHTDTTKGSEMPALIAAGEYDKVMAHCRADLDLTKALAERMGVA